MQNDNVPLYEKVFVAIMSGIFSIAIAISVQHIKILSIPRYIVAGALALQFLLSLGVFIAIMLFFKSALVPPQIPNDDWTALVVAFTIASFPHIITTTLIFLYDKEISKWVKQRYGEDADIPTMSSRVVSEALTNNVQLKEDNKPQKPKPPTTAKKATTANTATTPQKGLNDA